VAEAEKKAAREQRTTVFIDEAAFYLLPGVVNTYAPRGETPVLRGVLTRDQWSVRSGLTPQGHLFSLRRDYPLTSWESRLFLCHWRRRIGTALVAIWDGAPLQRSEERKTFLAQGGTPFVQLAHLPPYAPDLNPDEGVWQQRKNVALRKVWGEALPHLSHALTLALRRLRRKPAIIQSFFAEAGLQL
jgi:DDE superfamily endonuclease